MRKGADTFMRIDGLDNGFHHLGFLGPSAGQPEQERG